MSSPSSSPELLDSASVDSWPSLDSTQLGAMIGFNVISWILAYIILRIVYPPPTKEELALNKQLQNRIAALQAEYQSLAIHDRDPSINGSARRPQQKVECLEGESAGDYSAPWTQTFDLYFVLIMGGGFIVLSIWSTMAYPDIWTDGSFWAHQLPKLLVMMLVSYLGGLACRYFCEHDEKGYIITNSESVFKVNYTRKLQHFAAYLVPLLMHNGASAVPGELALCWVRHDCSIVSLCVF